MTSVLPPSASEPDDALYVDGPGKTPAEDYVTTPRRSRVPVFLAIAVTAVVIMGTVLLVLMTVGR